MENRERQLERVYQEHRAAVYHTALSFLKDPMRAEDVMQDVFLLYYDCLLKQEPIRNLRSWLLTVTRNRCLNFLRDHHRECLNECEPPLSEDPFLQVLQDDMVRKLLSCLSAEESLAFSLHYLDGYKYREIAAGLNLPMGTVQTRCRLARKKLRKRLREDDLEKEVGI